MNPEGRIVVLVPRRKDGGPRDLLWSVCRRRWEVVFGFPIYEGHHDHGPFNRSLAINDASRLADREGKWDLAIVIDSDILIDHEAVQAAIHTAVTTNKVTWPHSSWNGLDKTFTDSVIADPFSVCSPNLDKTLLEPSVEKRTPQSWSCCIVVPRDAWDFLGGFDERFRGWGFEDMAFQSAVAGLLGYERLSAPLYHLWHPRFPGLGFGARNKAGRLTGDAITNAKLGRRYMYALLRDHGLRDQPHQAELAQQQQQQELAILKADDRRLAAKVKPLGLPNWSGWWPTLTELLAHTPPPGHSVALVVHSGGTLSTWAKRKPLLIETLNQILQFQLKRSWERKVIFSDWPPSVRAELKTIAAEAGFYVVGPTRNCGYTISMTKMWRYIKRRVKADYVFQTEDDFAFNTTVNLDDMVTIMATRPYLLQLALLREAYYASERAASTILGHDINKFVPRCAVFGSESTKTRLDWLEHRQFFTCNPMLMRSTLARKRWPTARHSEAVFGRRLFADPDVCCAFLGDGKPHISHRGDVRAGTGY